jgi:hemoglobin
MNDITTETDVDFLVDQFYEKVNKNEILAPFFIHTNWEHHLPQTRAFWYFILLDKPGFKGNIFDAHTKRHIKPLHFDIWVQLFCEAVNENFAGTIAEKAIAKAKELSMLFSWKLTQTEGA